MEQPLIVTVSQVNSYLRILIERDKKLTNLRVRGEISNITAHSSGHLYFTMKDEKSVVRAVMWGSAARSLAMKPQEGLRVILTADVRVYEKAGQYQLVAHAMEPDGIGELYAAFVRLKEKLEKEGLFDPALKRPIPRYPKIIAVITAPTGAVWHDIQNVLARRYPVAQLMLYPSLVQGINAPDSLRSALFCVNRDRAADVLIIGRGGGSLEELWAFNDEQLARDIRCSRIPVISAVGHETDFSISDFVADLRAPTPSAAAELCAVNAFETLAGARHRVDAMGGQLRGRLAGWESQLKVMQARPFLSRPGSMLEGHATALCHLQNRLNLAAASLIDRPAQRLDALLGRIEALSPLSVLRRGYAVALKEGAVLTDVTKVKKGEEIDLLLSNGRLRATVTGKTKTTPKRGASG